ncbi:MAG: deoxyribose-phosphate aldolase [Lachnospiraceae bacterium]|nr:deoxyribose-phosphate aldolase [Lachnospiraceae bacterium]
MELKEILTHVDHTLLAPAATWEQIRSVCQEGIDFATASVCIPSVYVARAAEFVQGKIPICTVIGFPNGYSTTQAKCFEAAEAVAAGASEIDMVICLGAVKEENDAAVLAEINAVKRACGGRLLKVIIETCQLTREEKIRMCRVVSASEADYIKTSTGFSSGGATPEDVALLRRYTIGKKVKAAGGIQSIADAERFLELGADRLGTSRLVKLAKSLGNED